MKYLIMQVVVIGLNTIIGLAFCQDLKPEDLHAFVSPSVALIEDVGSHGSGIVVSHKGQILTNYHVVASGLPVKVTIKVKENGRIHDRTFTDVPVEYVHPNYDLALLQLPLNGALCAPVRMLPQGQDIKTGSACYAIGNPGDHEGRSLTHSITEGLVSSAQRVIDGLEFIQISAALNPGNSGGAVANAQGYVIGIATWKLGQADNIGFAIPLREIRIEDFVLLERRQRNPKDAEEFSKLAEQFYRRGLQLQGEEKELAIFYAVFFYRKALECMPNEPALLHNLGLMYSHLEETALSISYLSKANDLRPNDANTLEALGRMYLKDGRPVSEALKFWRQGLSDPDKIGVGACADNIAVSYLQNEKFREGAYFAKWALSNLSQEVAHRRETRNHMWEISSKQISDVHFRYLRNKTDGFSLDDYNRYLSQTSDGMSENTSPAVAQQTSRTYSIEIKPFLEFAEAARKEAVEIPAEGVTKPLPGKPATTLMGYAGTCLIMHFKDLNQLGVFDLNKATITEFIPLRSGDIVFAAGGAVLLIHYPAEAMFELWDMRDWKKKREFLYRDSHQIVAMGMGLMNHHFAFLIRPTAQKKYAILHLKSGEISEPELVKVGEGMSLFHLTAHSSERSRVYLNESGRNAVVTGSGLGSLSLADLDELKGTYNHTGGNLGRMGVSSDGKLFVGQKELYTPNDKRGVREKLDSDAVDRNKLIGLSIISGYDGFAELSFNTGGLCKFFLKTFNNSTVFEMNIQEESFPEFTYPHPTFKNLTELYPSMYAKRLAIIDPSKDSVTLVSMDGDVNSLRQFLAEPGETFKMPLSIPEGSQIEVKSGPEGLTYDPEEMSIIWDIPDSVAKGSEVKVIMMVTYP